MEAMNGFQGYANTKILAQTRPNVLDVGWNFCGINTAARRRESGNLMDTKERRKNMKTRANCAFGGCGKVDSKGAMCKHCGFDATQRRIRMAIIKQRGLSRDPATGNRKLIFKGARW